jgi:putrescine transport system ATP-binding protein
MAEPNKAGGFLVTENLVKRFDEAMAVDDVSLSIGRGEIFALLGSSGCGKSTLLRMLAGFEKPTSGRVLLGGQDVGQFPPYDRPMNMMFQSYALFPHLDIWENIAFGLKREGLPRAEIRQRVGEMLDLVQLGPFAKRKPHQLSGGQQQRVALARSLAKRPKLLLLDEPLGALDKKLREQTQFELVNIIEKVEVTCVMVTHDQEEAMTMASRIAVMSKGRVLQVGSPQEVYEHPANRFVADFIGNVNLFEGRISIDEADRCAVMTSHRRDPCGTRRQRHHQHAGGNCGAAGEDRHQQAKARAGQEPVHRQGQGDRLLRLLQHLYRAGQRRIARAYHRGQHLASWRGRHHLGGRRVLLVERRRRRGVARLRRARHGFPENPRARSALRHQRAICMAGAVLLPAVPDPAVHQLRGHGQRHQPFQADLGYRNRCAQAQVRELLVDLPRRDDGGALFETIYIEAYLRSIWYALCTALLCLFIGYPFSYFIARARPTVRPALLMMVMLPFWTSFLLRVYAWKGILADQGIVNQTLMWLGITSEPIFMLYTNVSMLVGMTYVYLPFMILPLYANLVKMDFRLLEAAYDLGTVAIQGLLAGDRAACPSRASWPASCWCSFPSVGEFVIPSLLGGPENLMIGRVVWDEMFTSNNWPRATALAVVMIAFIVVPLAIYYHYTGESADDRK